MTGAEADNAGACRGAGPAFAIDGVAPGRVVRPERVEDIAAALADEPGTVVPIGSGSQLYYGNPLRSADYALDLTGVRRIVHYNPADLTIHVEAGVTLGELQRTLAENNQMLPLDPWNGPDATIGGIAATAAQGPYRAVGSIRDWIIGMKVVHADGRISKTGGRVVKNVTGYDLARLYTGSLGMLAVIAEISFKVRPRFDKCVTAIARFARLEDAVEAVAAIGARGLQPVSCELAGPLHSVWLRFGEHPKAVDWQLAQLPAADWQILDGEREAAAWGGLCGQYNMMSPVAVRVVARPSQVRGVIEEFAPLAWIAHAMNGVVTMAFADAAAVPQLRKRFPAVLEKAPLRTRAALGVFGVRGRERQLMLEMKQAFDPDGRLNPGRHVDGE